MQTINLKTNKGNSINEVILIKPDIFSDKRGFFYESWNSNSFKKIIGNTNFCQDNHSNSIKGVLRGIHYQLNPTAQGKLVRCTKGEIYDVAVDLRKRSNTYKEWIGVKLNELNKNLFWIPEGFGHGFLTLSDIAEVQYKVTKPWDKLSEKSLLWNDSDLNIDWPLNKISPIISKKDALGITIKEAENMDFVFQ
ncbi:dTDP-4-dehydrorhamnose 3,5-epimerase and related enzymes [Prochlorococcus marinus str. MIT 9215]|uniref:dTDP-4-dehydrorhamnose 3,5-epimerase n=1 Tax=Prochlorococcus marinus (strain MIT 9215) TaxID=93060 RepID=A8G633_PROM2|nr:dTDP-4-dehydrorhamnose 3,5-epimerase [Prochlorococcus marinus]ABV51064.1 dTDP-4-dehydrorhamnose 3,5-epimerase and related enzymes [Prochlorococcus marinus str. MIT 9215]